MIYLELFLGFLRDGCFAFGGAYSAIPLIRDVVISSGWLTDDALTDMIAVSESTPGPIMINLATYVGSVKGGFLGSVVATFAVVLPSFVIILLVMVIFQRLMKNPYVEAVINGLIPCVIGIISAVGGYMMLRCCFATGADWAPDFKALFLTAFLALLMFGSKPLLRKKLSPIMLILISAVLGILFC